MKADINVIKSILEDVLKDNKERAVLKLSEMVKSFENRQLEEVDFTYQIAEHSKQPEKDYVFLTFIGDFFMLYAKENKGVYSYNLALRYPMISSKPNYYFVMKDGYIIDKKSTDLFFLDLYYNEIYNILMSFLRVKGVIK